MIRKEHRHSLFLPSYCWVNVMFHFSSDDFFNLQLPAPPVNEFLIFPCICHFLFRLQWVSCSKKKKHSNLADNAICLYPEVLCSPCWIKKFLVLYLKPEDSYSFAPSGNTTVADPGIDIHKATQFFIEDVSDILIFSRLVCVLRRDLCLHIHQIKSSPGDRLGGTAFWMHQLHPYRWDY